MMTVTTKYSFTQEGAVNQPGGGGKNKDDVMDNNSCGSSTDGSATIDVDGIPREAAGRRHWVEDTE